MEPKKSKLPDLPFSRWYPLLAGALAGVALRLVFFGEPGDMLAAMTGAFIFLSPLTVGAVTVYVAEKQQRRSWAYYFLAPFFANVLYVLGTMAIVIEGLICAAVIVPLFAVIGGVGGLIMGAICRATNWPKHVLYSVVFLPFLIAPLEHAVPLSDKLAAVERTVVINASPEQVWRQIINAPNIRSEEVEGAWLFRIGVPLPLTGMTHQTATGTERRVTMGKGIYFDEVFTDLQEFRYVRWTYRFHEDSFPRYALDEHVVIGGYYFDVIDTSYTLAPRGDATELKVRMQYRVSTRFNWYADPLARFLMGNLEESNLGFYKRRSEM